MFAGFCLLGGEFAFWAGADQIPDFASVSCTSQRVKNMEFRLHDSIGTSVYVGGGGGDAVCAQQTWCQSKCSGDELTSTAVDER